MKILLALLALSVPAASSLSTSTTEQLFSIDSQRLAELADRGILLLNVKNYIAQLTTGWLSGTRTVNPLIYSKDHIIHDVAADMNHMRLFFFDAAERHIYLADLVSHPPRIATFMNTSQSVRGLLYDDWSENLYWIDSDRGTMCMCSIEAKYETVIRKDLERPISMVLDSTNRVFYIAMLGSLPHIMRTDIFGNEHSDLMIIGTDIGLPVALYLDEHEQRLYWADARRMTIESLDLDLKSASSGIKANSRQVHRRNVGTILALAVYHDQFVWMVKNGEYLYKASRVQQVGKDDKESFKLPPNPAKEPPSDNKRIILVDPSREPASNSPCRRRGCSHGCVLDANKRAVCVCPDAYKLQASNQTNCVHATHLDCAPNMFKCLDTSHCILGTWRCDGTPDCDDASDEHDCHLQQECPKGDFSCKNGHCISQAWHCDSSDDCGDNSDEEDCPHKADDTCTVGYFSCGDGKCIPQLWRCDREQDCHTGLDELDCRSEACKVNYFKCNENHQCIPRNWLCDSVKDCPQGEDEAGCDAPGKVECKHDEQFLCDQHLCLDTRLRCDGHKDCLDGTDELNCPAKGCPAHMRSCKSDQHCIYPSDFCDGHMDCEDGSDERNCTNRRVCASYEIQCESPRINSSQLALTTLHHDSQKASLVSSSLVPRKCIPRAWLCDGEDDCGDWSDEMNEKCMPPSYDHMITTTSKPCHDGSFPCQSGECISWQQVCNQEDDCLDGSDEAGKCLVSCSINNGGCAQTCRSSPSGPSCACLEGYYMSNETKTCEDTDECLHPGICSHYCYNFKGGYKCACAPGYLLAADRRHCRALGSDDPFILFMLPGKILATGLVHYQEKLIASSAEADISGMDYDFATERVFWAESDNGRIMSQSYILPRPISSPRIQLDNLNKPAQLAYDWLTGNIYMAQARGTLHVCNLNSKRCAQLFNGRIIKSNTLAVAPTVGLMFWAISSDDTSTSGFVSGIIERAEMDGTHRKTIVGDKIHQPMSLAVDYVLNRIYWTDMKLDEIYSVDLAGRGRQIVLAYSLQNPAGLSLFEDSLYVSNIGSYTLLRCNKFSGNSRQELSQGEVKSHVLRVVHQVSQPRITNPLLTKAPCFNSTCSHLCTLANSTRTACICPDGHQLGPDRATCLNCAPSSCAETLPHPKGTIEGHIQMLKQQIHHQDLDRPSGAIAIERHIERHQEPIDHRKDAKASALNVAPVDNQQEQQGGPSAWIVVLILFLCIAGLAAPVILYKQGRLPRQVSQLSVSFISSASHHDKDGAMLLLDSD